MRKLQSLAADQATEEPDLESVLRDEIGHIRPLHKRGDEQKAWDAEDAKAREIAINASKDHTPVGNAKQVFTSLFGL
jgi:hypothetical protein